MPPPEIPYSQVVKGAVDQIARSFSDLGTVVSNAIELTSHTATQSLAQSLSTLNTGLNGVNTTLGLIRSTLAGVVKTEVSYPDAESTVYRGFKGTITGTSTVPVWSTPSNSLYNLKGYAIAAIVSPDALAATEGVLLYLQDQGTTNTVVAPIAVFGKTAAPEISVTGGVPQSLAGVAGAVGVPVVVHLGSGRVATYQNPPSSLHVAADVSIGAGDIKVVGVVWGNYKPKGSL